MITFILPIVEEQNDDDISISDENNSQKSESKNESENNSEKSSENDIEDQEKSEVDESNESKSNSKSSKKDTESNNSEDEEVQDDERSKSQSLSRKISDFEDFNTSVKLETRVVYLKNISNDLDKLELHLKSFFKYFHSEAEALVSEKYLRK